MTVITDESKTGIARVGFAGSQYLRTPSSLSSSAKPYDLMPTFASEARLARTGGRCVIAVSGDSTTCGYDGSYTNKKRQNLAFALAGMMRAAGLHPSTECFMGSQNVELTGSTIGAYDPRITLGGSWTTFALNGVGKYCLYMTAANTGTATFQMSDVVDTIEVYYATDVSGNGSFTVDIGGASLADVSCSQAKAMRRQTFTVTPGVYAVNFKRGAGTGNVYVLGVIAYDSRKPSVAIVNTAWNGSTSSDFAASANPWDYSGGSMAVIDPSLTIHSCQINDWRTGVATATHKTNTQTYITAAKAAGDVLLWTAYPSDVSAATLAAQAGLVQAYKELADTNACALVDVNAWVGSYTRANSLGLYADTFHPANALYARSGQLLGSVVAAAAVFDPTPI